MMTINFKDGKEYLPTMDPIHSAMMAVDSTSTNPHTNPMDSVEKYLPESQSLEAVLKLETMFAPPGYMPSTWK